MFEQKCYINLHDHNLIMTMLFVKVKDNRNKQYFKTGSTETNKKQKSLYVSQSTNKDLKNKKASFGCM